eukprot:5027663-Prymnesium_polylepis.1
MGNRYAPQRRSRTNAVERVALVERTPHAGRIAPPRQPSRVPKPCRVPYGSETPKPVPDAIRRPRRCEALGTAARAIGRWGANEWGAADERKWIVVVQEASRRQWRMLDRKEGGCASAKYFHKEALGRVNE